MIARRGKIHIWAAGLSAAVHVALLGGFAAVRLGSSSEPVASPLGAVSMRTVRQTVEQPLVTPKPEIKPEVQMPPVPQPVEVPQPAPVKSQSLPAPQQPVVQPPVSEPVIVDTPPETLEAEFFGQDAVARTICFVVDCSGSMYGRMGLITKQLKDCIASLYERQSFYMIFFMDGNKLYETGDGKAMPASGAAKARAFEMIDTIHLEGQTNAQQALERAMKIRDSIGRPVELIYFLTDGFDLRMDSSQMFCADIANLRHKHAPSVCINTIGLWVSAEDLKTLRTIAEMTGGQCISVQEVNDNL